VWNVRDESIAWIAALSELVGGADGSQGATDDAPSFGDGFESVERAPFAHQQPLDVEELVALVSTRSYVIAMREDARARLLDEVRALRRDHPDLQGRELIVMQYTTLAWRACKRLA
jgi:hypothetical protein